jgi:CheY-like chemotaxis protein
MRQFDSSLLQGIRILVAEDDSDLRESLVGILQMFGAETLDAENGKKAFEILCREKVDFILSDIRMPGGDGVSFLEKVRERDGQYPPFFFLSGFSDVTPEIALAKGAQALLLKPCDSIELAQRIAAQFQMRSAS